MLHADLEAILKKFSIWGIAAVIPVPDYKQTVIEYTGEKTQS